MPALPLLLAGGGGFGVGLWAGSNMGKAAALAVIAIMIYKGVK